jgi:hypothetical protein
MKSEQICLTLTSLAVKKVYISSVEAKILESFNGLQFAETNEQGEG